MAVANFQDRRREALAQGQTAADRLDRLFAAGRATPSEIDTAVHIYANVASAYINCHGLEAAIGFARRALDISEGVAEARMRRASALARLSQALRFAGGSFDEALAATRESRTVLAEIAERGGTAEQFNLANALTREGDTLGGDVLGEHAGISLNRREEAVGAFQKAIDIVDGLAARDPNDYMSRRLMATFTFQMAAVLRHTDPRAALRACDYAVARLEEVPTNARVQRDTVLLMTGSSYTARQLGQPDEAKRRIDRAAAILRDVGLDQVDAIELVSSEAYFLMRAIADHKSETGQAEDALHTYRELLTKVLRSEPDPEHDLRDAAGLADTWAAYAKALRRAGQPHEAETVERRRAALWSGWNERHPANPFIERQLASLTIPV
jgi:tetratricopeptide (TPR) repeat protein